MSKHEELQAYDHSYCDPAICVYARRDVAERELRRAVEQGQVGGREFQASGLPVRLAKVLQVIRRGSEPGRLYIDGALFEYATLDGYSITTRKGEFPALTLKIVANRVEFLDDLDRDGPPLVPDVPKKAPMHYGPSPYEPDMAGRHCGFGGPIVANEDRTTQVCTCDRESVPDGLVAIREPVPVAPDDALRLVAQGRRAAAESIRQQARYFGVEGQQGTMLSVEVAAQLAEGATGVKGGGS